MGASQMNLAAMLIQANGAKTGRKRPKVADRTPEIIEKRKNTMRRRRNERWAAWFAQFGGTASTNQLAGVSNYQKSSVGTMMRAMSEETPPLVRKVGEIEKVGRGPNQFVWEWIG